MLFYHRALISHLILNHYTGLFIHMYKCAKLSVLYTCVYLKDVKCIFPMNTCIEENFLETNLVLEEYCCHFDLQERYKLIISRIGRASSLISVENNQYLTLEVEELRYEASIKDHRNLEIVVDIDSCQPRYVSTISNIPPHQNSGVVPGPNSRQSAAIKLLERHSGQPFLWMVDGQRITL